VERRFAVFLVLTLLMWTSFIFLRAYLAPEPPVAKAKKGEVAEKKVAPEEQPAEKAAEPAEKAAEPPAQPEIRPAPPEPAALPAAAPNRQRLTLGSADPASGFSALYYFDNRGAALECAELSSHKSVEDYGGYLGRLDADAAGSGGVLVNVVGPGTPAAQAAAAGVPAGLAVGDVIKSINGVSVATNNALETYLQEQTRPGQSVTLAVERAGRAEPIQFKATLVRRPLEIVRPESHEFDKPRVEHPLSLLLTLDRIGTRTLAPGDEEFARLPSLHNSNWTVENQGNDFVEFSFTLDQAALAAAKIENAGPLKVIKRYTVPKAETPGQPRYHLDLQVSIQNLGEEPLRVAYRLGGPTGLPLEGWWYNTKLHPKWAGAGARDIVWDQPGFGHQLLGCPAIVDNAKKLMKKEEPPLSEILAGDQAAPLVYAGVDTQFFASVIQPRDIEGGQPILFRNAYALALHDDVTKIPKTRLRTANVTVRLITSDATIEPSKSLTHDYQVFLGPKDPEVLAEYRLGRLIEYGWRIFEVPAKLLTSVLNGLYWLTGLIGIPNYGIAIILLTVIVRSCMIPVSLKQARSAAKMQELAPEIQKIKDKYPDEPMKQHQAVQELYKKHDFNMFGGCLPVFIQLPIFIGLYRCLSVDIDLRDASLIPGIAWASNLAGPDRLFRWDGWMPGFIADEADGWLGPFFNVFPLITVALFLVQQKMFTPPATDEQTKMQQQMMTYMTVFMGVMFYKVPAGLCIYFITSSLWGIAERKLLPKPKPKESRAEDSGGPGGGGLVARLMPQKPQSPNGAGKRKERRPQQRKM
jgi:YidC/Oxa1 family membrane protein insertase